MSWVYEFGGGGQGSKTPAPSPRHNPPRILLTGPPQCGKTTVVHRVPENFPGQAAGFYTREVRVAGRRVGFEIVTLDGDVAWLSHVDFPGPQRVGSTGWTWKGYTGWPCRLWSRPRESISSWWTKWARWNASRRALLPRWNACGPPRCPC